MKQPQARHAYRVPRRPRSTSCSRRTSRPSRCDRRSGTVTDTSATDRTIEVDDAGEIITVVVLGTKPTSATQVDYYVVDGLAYTPEPSVGAGGVVYVQPDDPGLTDPGVYVVGQLWFDTDETVP